MMCEQFQGKPHEVPMESGRHKTKAKPKPQTKPNNNKN